MTDKEFKKLKQDIEIKMVELWKLQEKYHKETGKDYVMPLYIETPKHLKGIK
jgi:hypothetical protein